MSGWSNEERKTRAAIIRDLWCQHGCSAAMTIHIKQTAEMNLGVDGFIRR